MKVTVSYNPQDKKEVLDTLYLVSPNTANVTRADLAKIIRSYALKIRNDGSTHSLKDVFSYVDSLNLIGK
jgi:hypothetical protein